MGSYWREAASRRRAVNHQATALGWNLSRPTHMSPPYKMTDCKHMQVAGGRQQINGAESKVQLLSPLPPISLYVVMIARSYMDKE